MGPKADSLSLLELCSACGPPQQSVGFDLRIWSQTYWHPKRTWMILRTMATTNCWSSDKVRVMSPLQWPKSCFLSHDVLKRESLPNVCSTFLQNVLEAKPVLSYVFGICAHEQDFGPICAPCADSLHHV